MIMKSKFIAIPALVIWLARLCPAKIAGKG
jgi:hypothetical protein